MRNITSFINKTTLSTSEKDQIASSSTIDLQNSRLKNNIDDEDDALKKDGALELSHLEYGDDLKTPDGLNAADAAMRSAAVDAMESDETERNLSLIHALKQYPKAIGWSLLISTTLVMEGFDTTLLNSLFALPVFQRKFGELNLMTGGYEISSQWQLGLNMCIYVGEILGLQITGVLVEKLGNRWTMILALTFLFAFNFILYFCQSLAMIAVGMILSGMPWGCFQSLAVSYASEVCPLALRYYLTTYVNMCWLFGQIFASGILKNSEQNLSNSDMGYKLPFALQWIWPAPLAIGIFLAPESPWWLMKKNRQSEAEKSLVRLSSLKNQEREVSVKMMLEKIKLTIEKEAVEKTQQGSFKDCFKGVDGRRTRVACLTWVAQNTSGSVLLGYSTYFFEKAGLDTSYAFTFAIIQYCLGLAGTIGSWILSGRLGRFQILFGGLVFQMIVLFIIGGLGFSSNTNASWGIGSLLIILSFFYNMGIGPVVYCIVSEIPSARLRTQTIVLARNCYNLMAVVNAIWTPYMLNTNDWNWGAKTGLFWGGFTALTLLWVFFELPETSGRTFSEVDELFAQGVPARKFKSTHVDPFAVDIAKNVGHDSTIEQSQISLGNEEHIIENKA